MNIWANAVVTNKGLALQAKLIEGATLTITRAVTGTGTVAASALKQQTTVSGEKQTMTFRPVAYPETGKCSVPVHLTNDTLTTGYTIMQIGIYANDPDEGEILYFLCQAETGTGTPVPSVYENPGFSAEWNFTFQYGQADNVSVTVDPANTINATQAQQMIEDMAILSTAAIVGSNDDLNDYTDVGIFTYSAGSASTIKNAPETGVQSTMVVLPRLLAEDENNRIQIVATGNDRIFIRNKYNGLWNAWERAATLTELNNHGRHVPDACTTIGDWNTAVKTGWYMGNNASNAPTTAPQGGTMWYFGYVIAHNSNYVLQEVYQFTASNDAKSVAKYIRACKEGVWGPWTDVTVQTKVPHGAKLDYIKNLTSDAQAQLDNTLPAKPSFIEFNTTEEMTHGGYLDFHYSGSTKDYTTRIIEEAEGHLRIMASMLRVSGILQIADGDAGLYGDDHTVNVVTKSDAANDYKRSIQLMNKAYEADVADALILIDKDSSGARNYKIYGEHNKPTAADIGGGTLGGRVRANATNTANVGDSQIRNINAGTTDLIAGSDPLETGALYFVYE